MDVTSRKVIGVIETPGSMGELCDTSSKQAAPP
jgi:hypothetical protein